MIFQEFTLNKVGESPGILAQNRYRYVTQFLDDGVGTYPASFLYEAEVTLPDSNSPSLQAQAISGHPDFPDNQVDPVIARTSDTVATIENGFIFFGGPGSPQTDLNFFGKWIFCQVRNISNGEGMPVETLIPLNPRTGYSTGEKVVVLYTIKPNRNTRAQWAASTQNPESFYACISWAERSEITLQNQPLPTPRLSEIIPVDSVSISYAPNPFTGNNTFSWTPNIAKLASYYPGDATRNYEFELWAVGESTARLGAIGPNSSAAITGLDPATDWLFAIRTSIGSIFPRKSEWFIHTFSTP